MSTIIGHKGACAYAPENTLESFKLALDMGADAIELDVHLSKDVILQSVENGVPANVWTVNTEDIMEECIRQKAGIITDYPDVAVALRKKLL